MTTEQLFDKIDWEGGIWSALEYGISDQMVPKKFAERWKLLQEAFGEAEDLWLTLQRDIEEELGD